LAIQALFGAIAIRSEELGHIASNSFAIPDWGVAIAGRRNYSYYNTRLWEPVFALIGDAACFIDSLFSFEVDLATYCASSLFWSINSCFAKQF
jgi:hypothetical protein